MLARQKAGMEKDDGKINGPWKLLSRWKYPGENQTGEG